MIKVTQLVNGRATAPAAPALNYLLIQWTSAAVKGQAKDPAGDNTEPSRGSHSRERGIPGRGNSQCKNPEAGPSLANLRKRKKTSGVRRKVKERKRVRPSDRVKNWIYSNLDKKPLEYGREEALILLRQNISLPTVCSGRLHLQHP